MDFDLSKYLDNEMTVLEAIKCYRRSNDNDDEIFYRYNEETDEYEEIEKLYAYDENNDEYVEADCKPMPEEEFAKFFLALGIFIEIQKDEKFKELLDKKYTQREILDSNSSK